MLILRYKYGCFKIILFKQCNRFHCFKSIILKLAGIILFIVILSRIDLKSFFDLLKDINLYYFISAVLLLFPILFIKAYRWNYLKKTQNINYKLSDSILNATSKLSGSIGFILVFKSSNGFFSAASSFSNFLMRLQESVNKKDEVRG